MDVVVAGLFWELIGYCGGGLFWEDKKDWEIRQCDLEINNGEGEGMGHLGLHLTYQWS